MPGLGRPGCVRLARPAHSKPRVESDLTVFVGGTLRPMPIDARENLKSVWHLVRCGLPHPEFARPIGIRRMAGRMAAGKPNLHAAARRDCVDSDLPAGLAVQGETR